VRSKCIGEMYSNDVAGRGNISKKLYSRHSFAMAIRLHNVWMVILGLVYRDFHVLGLEDVEAALKSLACANRSVAISISGGGSVRWVVYEGPLERHTYQGTVTGPYLSPKKSLRKAELLACEGRIELESFARDERHCEGDTSPRCLGRWKPVILCLRLTLKAPPSSWFLYPETRRDPSGEEKCWELSLPTYLPILSPKSCF
jgi:hypothetical protein